MTPVLLLLILAVAQYAMWQLGRELAQQAAHRGAAAARLQGGSDAGGRGEAIQAIAAQGPNLVGAPTVTVSRTATVVRVEVRGSAASVVPFLTLPIDAVSESPIEQIRTGP